MFNQKGTLTLSFINFIFFCFFGFIIRVKTMVWQLGFIRNIFELMTYLKAFSSLEQSSEPWHFINKSVQRSPCYCSKWLNINLVYLEMYRWQMCFLHLLHRHLLLSQQQSIETPNISIIKLLAITYTSFQPHLIAQILFPIHIWQRLTIIILKILLQVIFCFFAFLSMFLICIYVKTKTMGTGGTLYYIFSNRIWKKCFEPKKH